MGRCTAPARAHHYLERARGDLGLATAFTRCSIRTIKDDEPRASHRINALISRYSKDQLWIMNVTVLSNLLACILASRLHPTVASASAGAYLTLTQSLCIELALSSSAASDGCGVFCKGMWCAFVSARCGMRSVSCASARASCVSMRRTAAVSWERQRRKCCFTVALLLEMVWAHREHCRCSDASVSFCLIEFKYSVYSPSQTTYRLFLLDKG